MILGPRFPALPRRRQTRREAFVLFLLRCVDEQLHDISAAIDLLRLKLVDLVISAPPFGLAAEIFDPFDQDAAIPASIDAVEILRAWQFLPQAPEEMTRSEDRRVGKECGMTWK